MTKYKRILITLGLLSMIIAGVWLAIGPQTLARLSHMTYRTPTYTYTVELDTAYDSQVAGPVETGILVTIAPERSAKDASDFSGAYLQESGQRAKQWIAERRGDALDVMIIFSRPLNLEEANKVLAAANAQVFESGVVGYSEGVPFAGYEVEEGPRLTRTLAQLAELGGGFEPEIVADSDITAPPERTRDIRGYLAVRAWVDGSGLEALLKYEEVRLVDTTPQEVRDRLSSSLIWKDYAINALAIEMPVWAYEW